MMSHLPPELTSALTHIGQEVDESLQAKDHFVAEAIGVSPDYNQGWVESSLRRALLSPSVMAVEQSTFRVVELPNGGCELISVSEDVERRFRWKKAKLNRRNFLVVRANSDSILVHKSTDRHPTLWDDWDEAPPEPTIQQWVLAYIPDPLSGGFRRLYAAWVEGTLNETRPYTLTFVDPIFPIPLAVPPLPTFPGGTEELDVPDEEGQEDEGDEGDEGAA